ncbi:cytochrome P450 [Streptomyces phaeochromogenes]|uniref:Cytochrome P450 n=1 Tax=Streptomyces phaeochromogenes TaxID=1923 RepID=A0ABZ1HM54_STRPH|nr:cytochrome P450 [Streptomyces phaeochromogenes]WSD19693.1 cytochrome P450 [Streptomyces phaeochromogenes]
MTRTAETAESAETADTAEDYASTIQLRDLWEDPYPIYRRLRRHQPVAWVPAANRYLVTRHKDVVHLERHPEIFSAAEQESLMIRVMGLTMLRKDGPAHLRERKAAEPALRPRIVKQHWMPAFQRIADELIDGFQERGEADLFSEFAGPMAARCLALVLGLPEVDPADLQTWSQALMDGTGNYADDPVVWQRSETAAHAIDEAVDTAIGRLRAHPDASVISAMLHAADPLTPEEIRGNLKMFIGGGLNEPRDLAGVATYALLSHPGQRALAEADPARFRDVFEEAARWVAPIGMYPRQTTTEVELGGTLLPAGARLGVVLGSANRDEDVFADPDAFDIDRGERSHVAFGGGPHFCLGSWAARAQVGQVSLPTLFRRLKGLRLSDTEPVRLGGWVFRGTLNLPVRWEP